AAGARPNRSRRIRRAARRRGIRRGGQGHRCGGEIPRHRRAERRGPEERSPAGRWPARRRAHLAWAPSRRPVRAGRNGWTDEDASGLSEREEGAAAPPGVCPSADDRRRRDRLDRQHARRTSRSGYTDDKARGARAGLAPAGISEIRVRTWTAVGMTEIHVGAVAAGSEGSFVL